MNYFTGIKDFIIDMLSPKTSYRHKKMRLFARIPRCRKKYGGNIDTEYGREISKGLDTGPVILNEGIDRIVKTLNFKGYYGGISLHPESINKLLHFCNQSDFFLMISCRVIDAVLIMMMLLPQHLKKFTEYPTLICFRSM